MMILTESKIEDLIEVLNLEELRDKDGYFTTKWGKKTDEGLRATIKTILEEE